MKEEQNEALNEDKNIRKKRHLSFTPSHQDVKAAIEEFLKKGGKIKQLIPEEDRRDGSWVALEDSSEVDEFLQE